jgi:tRNA-dihydrouridine synthase A
LPGPAPCGTLRALLNPSVPQTSLMSVNFPLLDRRVSVAPMMDYTDRHCRYFHRLLTPSALLYTEMVTSKALLHGDVERLLGFDPAEQPVALQLGGSDPDELAQAARLGERYGYREINLNCGCPSDRVQSGRFGACLMAEPERVRDCIAAMLAAVRIPVTVKCRIGIEPGMADLDDGDFLQRFVSVVAQSGCSIFVVHARRAILNGLSPKENREIPPLQYPVAAELKRRQPQLCVVLNGGVRTTDQALQHLQHFDGVMIGREAYQNPWLLAQLHQALYPHAELPDRAQVVLQYAHYAAFRLAAGDRMSSLIRPLLGLYFGLPRARAWRRFLSERAADSNVSAQLLEQSLRMVA